jgi:hypothetical protein
MLRTILKTALTIVAVVAVGYAVYTYLSYKPVPERITYGLSFNTIYARELGLDEQEVYTAILDELGVRHLRLAAHWTLVEPKKDAFDWSAIDFEVREASERQADIVMGVGRRLPRWPECHVPEWAKSMTWEEQKVEIRELITETVNRYKDEPAIVYWQVENEPFLEVFAKEHCGELDKDFLREEIALVRQLDPTRPILVTDSGNLGTWHGAYRAGDAFGTSVYVYFWNPELGQFKTLLPPEFYRLKEGVMRLLFGDKKTFLIELSAEPWLLEPIVDVPIETQLTRMNPTKFEEILAYARETRYDTQYLWGAEWWYWLKLQGHTEMWEKGIDVFTP